MESGPQQSWITVPDHTDFTIYNLPYGIFLPRAGKARAGVAIGEQVLDLQAVAELGFFDHIHLHPAVFAKPYLNDFIALGKPVWQAVRKQLITLLTDMDSPLKPHAPHLLHHQQEVEMLLPVRIGDYTDFYSSEEHATNVGKMFRDPENALLPNWKHLPVAYHGRASSICVSGTPVYRPRGQLLPKGETQPVFGPSRRLDFELEMAFIVGANTEIGSHISTAAAEDHIFGLVLFNDWSARDIQKWEYVPLGPFLGKSFASTISPWVVTLDALEPFRTAGPGQDPPVLPYLAFEGDKNFDIDLEVGIIPKSGTETTICRSNAKYLYWNMAQQLAHHTVNGCNLRVGDMMASGTISGPEKGSFGSMLELSWGGKYPLTVGEGIIRTFLEDYDTVVMRGHAEKGDIRIGFGEVRAQILPPRS